MTLTRARVRVEGIVQGVGFRPFVHALAGRLGLAGLVGNDAGGVFVGVEGAAETVERFLEALATEAPPRAVTGRRAGARPGAYWTGGRRPRGPPRPPGGSPSRPASPAGSARRWSRPTPPPAPTAWPSWPTPPSGRTANPSTTHPTPRPG